MGDAASVLRQSTCQISDSTARRCAIPGLTVKVRCAGARGLILEFLPDGSDRWLLELPGQADGEASVHLGSLNDLSVVAAKQRARAMVMDVLSRQKLAERDARRQQKLAAKEALAAAQQMDGRKAKPWPSAELRDMKKPSAFIIRHPALELYACCPELPELRLFVPFGGKEYWGLNLPKHPNKPTIRLGTLEHIPVEIAKKLARSLVDPPQQTPDDGPVLKRFLKSYWHMHGHELKPSTQQSYRSRIRQISKAFGDLPLTWISHRAVQRWHAEYSRRSPGSADEAKGVLRSVINLAKARGVIDPGHPNPCDGISLNRPGPGNRSLSPSELAALGAVLDEAEHDPRYRTHALRIRFILFTGLRAGEARTLTWSSVVCEEGRPSHLQLPDSKTGPRRIELNEKAAELLMRLPRRGNRPVFPAFKQDRRSTDQVATHAWRRFANAAGLPPESRQYWLRHTFGSNAILEGCTLLEVAALLGHSNPATTRRYIHLPTKTTITAGERIGGKIAGWLGLPALLDELEREHGRGAVRSADLSTAAGASDSPAGGG